MNNKAFYLETFGCQMNVVDSERIVDLLGGIGYQQVEQPDQAGLILLNTCAVRDKAVRKAYGHLGRFKPLKDRNPELILGMGGCIAQQEGKQLLEEFPYLDLVFGTHNVHRLPEMVQNVADKRVRCEETDFLDHDTRLQLFLGIGVGGVVDEPFILAQLIVEQERVFPLEPAEFRRLRASRHRSRRVRHDRVHSLVRISRHVRAFVALPQAAQHLALILPLS